jgi:RNA polymerase sigma-70 factor, ECF subfamily
LSLFDDEVADRVRSGDADAIAEVYTTLGERLLGYLVARVGDRSKAEDLLETTFVKLIERGHTIKGGSEVIKSWLFRTAHYCALDQLRGERRLREDLSTEHLEVIDTSLTPEEEAVAADTGRRVREMMAHLTDEQQEVLLLRYVAGLSSQETADVLHKNLSAVKGLQHRAERSLARLMENDGPPASWRPSQTSQE